MPYVYRRANTDSDLETDESVRQVLRDVHTLVDAAYRVRDSAAAARMLAELKGLEASFDAFDTPAAVAQLRAGGRQAAIAVLLTALPEGKSC
jgi:hypothetical protein